MTWLPSPIGVLAFRRDPGFACMINMSTVDAPLIPYHEILIASGPLPGGLLAPDTAVWLRTS
jgi:alpha-glucosidase